jgi:hypothetical protein
MDRDHRVFDFLPMLKHFNIDPILWGLVSGRTTSIERRKGEIEREINLDSIAKGMPYPSLVMRRLQILRQAPASVHGRRDRSSRRPHR